MTSPLRWIDRSDRVRLEVRGPDRARFLHNLMTNDIKRLPVGAGCEAFVTSLQGKTLGFVSVLAADDLLLVRSDPGTRIGLLPHLEKYGVFDDVTLADVSAETVEIHLFGAGVDETVHGSGCDLPPERDLAHVTARAVRIVRESPTGLPGLTFIAARADADAVAASLQSLGATSIDPAAFDALRIEAGTPVFGRDISPDNLPQEVGRDARAINFVKGCYLGQETVARLDALGHVNKLLKGLRLEGTTVPPAGSPVEAEGKTVGTVTSAAFSPGWGRPIALAYLRVQHARPGTMLRVALDGGPVPAVVADLPMLPPG